MPSVTNYITKEHSVADTGSQNMGSAKDDHAPIGYSGSWLYREYMRFPSSGPPSGAKIVSCILSLKTTSGVHFQHGSGPRILIHRLTSDFAAEGGGTETWRTDADPVWGDPNPTATGAGEADVSFGNADQYVRTFNITDIYEAICSSGYFKRDGTPAGGSTNHGIRIRASGEGSSTNRVEFYSMRGSYVPRVEITWTVPKAATAPALIGPLGVQPAAPTEFSFQWPSGDGTEKLEIEVGTALDTSNLWNPAPTSHTPGPVKVVAYGGAAIPVDGSTVYWRVRGLNEVGTPGPWSKGTFTVATNPTAAISHPPNNGIAETWNLQSSLAVWASAEGKPRIKVLYGHPGGLQSASFDVEDDGVVTNYPLIADPGETVDIDLTTGWVRNVNHNVRVRANGSGGLQSAWTAMVACRIQWAQGMYNIPHVAGARDFVEAHGALTGGGQVAFLYRNTAVPASWFEDIGGFAKGTSIDMLVRLGASETTHNPTLPVARIEWYGSGTSVPDFWTKSGTHTLTSEKGQRRFGIHSAHVVATAAGSLYQSRAVTVTQGVKYTASAYVRVIGTASQIRLRILQGNAAAFVPEVLAPYPGTGGIADTSAAPDGWHRLYWTFTAPAPDVRIAIWNSAATEYWVDAVQLEEGEVAAGWKPGNAGPAVVVDVGGVAIDATFGGIFRLQGSLGGSRDRVELYEQGLRFAQDTELSSPSTGVLAINDVPIVNAGRQLLTASGNFTKPACTALMVECVGGGGGGGGAPVNTASQSSAGAGGGGGGYSRKVFTGAELTALPASIPYTIGAAGTAGGSAAGAMAGNGGNTTFNNGGAIVPTGGGGLGGEGGTATTTGNASSPGLGGAGSNGDLNISGSDGGAGRVVSAAPAYVAHGGASYFAGMSAALAAPAGGKPYGGGSAGVQNSPSGTAKVGVAGAAGVIFVTWW